MPQAQAITDAEPAVSELGNEPQAGQDLVEVSLYDIDDGPGDLPSFVGGRRDAVGVPRGWQSRGGIVLDTAAVPPGLPPLVSPTSVQTSLHPMPLA